jgi:Xaa-Pro dipeptidase
MFEINKFWHKRIVRSGENTLLPYQENPPNLTLKDDDIVFLDFGPIFEIWEADIGKTYVIGNDTRKLKMKLDVEKAWQEGKEFFERNKKTITGSDFYEFTKKLANKFGWEFGNEHCGHLIGMFPHEKLQGEEISNYIHPENNKLMIEKDKNGKDRFWIYEIHFIDKEHKIGGFFEQLLTTN